LRDLTPRHVRAARFRNRRERLELIDLCGEGGFEGQFGKRSKATLEYGFE
jgi:hypothetical protein